MNIIIGCVVGIGVPVIGAFLYLIYLKFFRNKGKSFINSEGELVTKKHGAEAMIDEKYFDETVGANDDDTQERYSTSGDDTMVNPSQFNRGSSFTRPNNATNF